ncbi:DUF4435 domain-containing protein [Flavobacterium sp. TP390]|uniref:DUF4435 domain-containing protein n=1 Tax=Flavobacterium profundi TaxID=1774945 RepID=A0A6I4IRF7_9FLAO|nr:DUF4435 domain-containing protein [Flavobacterium profundi]MVO07766.1 DUF4435 domain-containing protein [Flavobacterium profundi]
MEETYKRKLSEHIALLELEPTSKNLFIEGPEDGNIFELFLDFHSINDVQIYPIDIIDFSELDENIFSNREKVLLLSRKIYEKFDNSLNNIACVIDKDFDVLNENFNVNPYLYYTDYANLEMYLFNNKSLNKILKIGLKNFPLSSEEVIKTLTPILVDNFCLRYAREKINCSYQLIQPEKIFNYSQGGITYNQQEILNKFLVKNNCVNKLEDFKKEIEFVKDKFKELNEPRLFIHGKDFLEFFFLLIKKIKNTYSYTLKTFTRAVFLSIENDLLNSYGLFSNIELKYRKI